MRAKIESTILVAAAPDTRKRIGPTSNSMAVSAGGVFAPAIDNGKNRFAAGGRRPFVGAMPRRRRHLPKLLRGTPRSEQNADTVSPDAWCAAINSRQTTSSRRARFRAHPRSADSVSIVPPPKRQNDAQVGRRCL